jgi:hypothetical protein
MSTGAATTNAAIDGELTSPRSRREVLSGHNAPKGLAQQSRTSDVRQRCSECAAAQALLLLLLLLPTVAATMLVAQAKGEGGNLRGLCQQMSLMKQ